MSKRKNLNKWELLVTGLAIGLLIAAGLYFIFRPTQVGATQVCQDVDKYITKDNDSTSTEVNFNFNDNDKNVDITADAGYTITEVWLDVNGDGISGFVKYGTTAGNYNPSGSDTITEAKVRVVKACPTATPTVTPTPTPYIDEQEYCEDDSALNYKEEGECEYPEPTPMPQNNTGGGGVEPNYTFQAPICTGEAPKAAIAVGGERIDSDTVLVFWHPTTDPIEFQLLRYGYTPDNLVYGIPHLDKNANEVELNFVLDNTHVWFQVGSERDACQSWSNVIDP